MGKLFAVFFNSYNHNKTTANSLVSIWYFPGTLTSLGCLSSFNLWSHFRGRDCELSHSQVKTLKCSKRSSRMPRSEPGNWQGARNYPHLYFAFAQGLSVLRLSLCPWQWVLGFRGQTAWAGAPSGNCISQQSCCIHWQTLCQRLSQGPFF